MTSLSRRHFVGGGAALMGAGAGAVLLRAPASVSNEPGIRSVPAARFADLVGLNAHATWRSTLWGETDWESAFLRSGVRHVRSRVGRGPVGRATLADLQKLFANNIRLCAGVTGATLNRADTQENIDFLANHVGSRNLSAIEGPNEYNKPSSAPADWAEQLREFMTWMHATVRSHRALANVPIVAPSIWGRQTEDYHRLGNLEPYVDRSNLHYYTGGRRPTRGGKPNRKSEGGGSDDYTLADAIREARLVAPSRPLWITEYGYPIAGPGASGARGLVSESAAAKYLIRGLFDAFENGAEKVFIYSLIDDVHRTPPRYHGLLDGGLQERQTFNAVRNLMALFADSGRTPAPATLAHRVTNETDSIRRHLFQKSDGSFLLAMYQDVDSYDRFAKRNLTVAPVPVKVELARPASTVEVFHPSLRSAAAERSANARMITVPVGDHVTIVRIAN